MPSSIGKAFRDRLPLKLCHTGVDQELFNNFCTNFSCILMTQSLDTNKSSPLLDRLLEGRDEQYKAKILQLVSYCGITDFNDPMFLFLLATGQLQLLLTDAPKDLGDLFAQGNKQTKQIFDKWAAEISSCLLGVEQGIVLRQQRAIAEASKAMVEKVIKDGEERHKKFLKDAERAESRRLFKSILPAAGILTAIFGAGCFMGMTVPPYLQGGYVGTRNLTAEDVASLNWASSAEGKKAKQLMEWNRDYLDVCEKDAKALGVKLTFGKSQADGGYCILWTRPPQERGLKPSK